MTTCMSYLSCVHPASTAGVRIQVWSQGSTRLEEADGGSDWEGPPCCKTHSSKQKNQQRMSMSSAGWGTKPAPCRVDGAVAEVHSCHTRTLHPGTCSVPRLPARRNFRRRGEASRTCPKCSSSWWKASPGHHKNFWANSEKYLLSKKKNLGWHQATEMKEITRSWSERTWWSWSHSGAQTLYPTNPQTTNNTLQLPHPPPPGRIGSRDLWRHRALILHFTNPWCTTDSGDVTD